jgi:putative addiction module component (TIGR02574 family)
MDPARLLSELLALPREERRAIALRVLDSVDEPADLAYEDEWEAELQRRSQAIDAGTAKLHTHDEAMELIFGSRRKQAI